MPHSNRRHHVSNFNSIFDHILSDSHLYMINQEEVAKMVILKKITNNKSDYHSKKKPELNHLDISHKANQNNLKYREKAVRGGISGVREEEQRVQWTDSLAGLGKGDERERGNVDERGA